MTVRNYTDRTGVERSQWTKIGAGFTNKDGSIGIELDCYPRDGRIVLQIPLSKEEKEAKFGTHGQAMRQETGTQQQQHYAEPQQQQQRPPPQQGYQQRPPQQQRQAAPPQGNTQRYRQPQPQFAPDPVPPPYAPADPGDQAPWTINGVAIYDQRDLPTDHPDYSPF